MEPIDVEALENMTAAIHALLPASADPILPPLLAIIPLEVVPSGVGGFVAMNADPVGEILGRRVRARVLVTAMAKDAVSLQTSVTNISASLLANRSALRAAGFLGVELADLGPTVNPAPGDVGDPIFQKQVNLELTYEFLKIPSETEDRIQDIPIGINVQ
jgi:hypothetical protein